MEGMATLLNITRPEILQIVPSASGLVSSS
jgi:hypothetical protein